MVRGWHAYYFDCVWYCCDWARHCCVGRRHFWQRFVAQLSIAHHFGQTTHCQRHFVDQSAALCQTRSFAQVLDARLGHRLHQRTQSLSKSITKITINLKIINCKNGFTFRKSIKNRSVSKIKMNFKKKINKEHNLKQFICFVFIEQRWKKCFHTLRCRLLKLWECHYRLAFYCVSQTRRQPTNQLHKDQPQLQQWWK